MLFRSIQRGVAMKVMLEGASPDQLVRVKGTLVDTYGEEYGQAVFEQEYLVSFDAANLGAILGRWLDRVERLTETTVDVAVHPKHDARDHRPYFGARRTVVGDTPESIRTADLVIATNSTAIGMAVMYGKPLILVTSNAANRGARKREQIALNGRETGARVFNIDEEYTDDEIRAALVVDEAKYARYTRKYLTTRTDDKRNYEILLEEVIWPYAELYRAEQERTGVGPDIELVAAAPSGRGREADRAHALPGADEPPAPKASVEQSL